MEARALVREAQQRHPEDFWINLHLGYILLAERPEEAVGYFRAAVASRPESSQAHIMVGRALHDAGDTDGAIAAFRKASHSLPISPLPGTWPRPWPEGAAWKRPVPSGQDSWKRLLRAYDPWDGYAQLCIPRQRGSVPLGPARPSSNAPETAPTTGSWPSATAWPVCSCRLPGRSSDARSRSWTGP